MAVVYTVANREHSYKEYKRAVGSLIDSLHEPMSRLISPGTRVFVKPFLRAGSTYDSSQRLTTHPDLLRALIEVLLDHRACVSFGGGGAELLKDQRVEGLAWVDRLQKGSHAQFVSFACTGGKYVQSHFLYPRRYLIANALLEADVIISCANLQPHGVLGLSGSIRNMFNAVLGKQQERLYSLFPGAKELSKVIADVCSLVRPNLSILDLTTVRDKIGPGPWNALPVNRIIACRDPAVIDSFAAAAVHFEGPLWTSVYGNQFGLGIARSEKIRVIGPPCELEGPARIAVASKYAKRKPTAFTKTTQLLSQTVLRSKPWIDPIKCTQCEGCIGICFAKAIRRKPDGIIAIDNSQCVECGYCVDYCDDKAVRLTPSHILSRSLHSTWLSAKNGFSLQAGGLALDFRVRPVKPLRGPRPPRFSRIRRGIRRIRGVGRDNPAPLILSSGDGDVAVIVGVGEKLGSALVRRLCRAEMRVVAVARDAQKLRDLEEEMLGTNGEFWPFACDSTDFRSVRRLFEMVEKQIGVPSLVVYNIEGFIPGSILEIQPSAFQIAWQRACYGGFLVGQCAAQTMVQHGRGTVIFGGATASRRGRGGYINLAVGKFGLRALAQGMARELGPRGIHVAHVVLDGGMLGMNPNAVADAYYNLYTQPMTAWSHEIDIRRFDETW